MSTNALIAQGVRPIGADVPQIMGMLGEHRRNALVAGREDEVYARQKQGWAREDAARKALSAYDRQGVMENAPELAAQIDQQAIQWGHAGVEWLMRARDPQEFASIAQTIAAHPMARWLGITPEQITPENVSVLAAQIGLAPGKPEQPEQFTMTPGSVRYERGPDGQVRQVAAVPTAPDKPPDESFSEFVDADGNVHLIGNRGTIRQTQLRGPNKSGGGVTIGPDGQLIATPDPSKASEGERTSANYADRMAASEELLGDYAPTIQDYMAARAVMKRGPLIASAANKVLSAEGQKYYQAAADWVRAKLRKESGAVISPEEMEQEIKTYFPLPNDSPGVIEQKRAARMQALAGMGKMAGRAASHLPAGSGRPKVGEVRKGYRYKGGDPAQQSSWEPAR